eukprot:758738-Hanusia_phi.AAC.6
MISGIPSPGSCHGIQLSAPSDTYSSSMSEPYRGVLVKLDPSRASQYGRTLFFGIYSQHLRISQRRTEPESARLRLRPKLLWSDPELPR